MNGDDAEVVGLVIVDDAAVRIVIWPPWQSIGSSGLDNMLIERGGVCDELEG